MLAAYAGRVEVCQLLLEYHSDKSITTNNGKTAVVLAYDAGHSDVANLIEKYGNDNGDNSNFSNVGNYFNNIGNNFDNIGNNININFNVSNNLKINNNFNDYNNYNNSNDDNNHYNKPPPPPH